MLGSREVTVEMEKLADMTKNVNKSMADMAAKTETVYQTVHNVLDISGKNLESINTVLNDLNRFKVQEDIDMINPENQKTQFSAIQFDAR